MCKSLHSLEPPSAPRLIDIRPTSPYCVTLTWDQPAFHNGEFAKYGVSKYAVHLHQHLAIVLNEENKI